MTLNDELRSIIENIRNKLIFIWRDAHKSQIIYDKFSGRRNLITQKGNFSIGLKGVTCLDSILYILKKEVDQYDDKFSDYYVKKLIDDSIINLIDKKEEEIILYAEIEAKKIIDKLQSPLIGMNFMIPIINLKMNINNLQIGKVAFHMFKEPIIDDNEPQKKFSRFLKEEILPIFKNKIIAEVNVKAIDDRKGNSTGKQLVYEALDVIRFFAIVGVVPQSYWSMNYFDIQGKIHQGYLVTLLEIIDKNKIICPERLTTGYLYSFDITSKFLEHMNKYGLNILNEILCKHISKRTDFENSIISAIRFAGSSYMYAEESESFIKCMIGLESLLLDERESKSENLAERVALIIADNLSDRNNVYDIMRELYNIRNKIVHEGYIEVSRNDVIQLQAFTFLCITNMLNICKKVQITNKNEFIKWTRDIKFS